MSPRTGAIKRWALWLSLLAVAAWLALFGDKSPAGDTAVSLPVKARAAASLAPPPIEGGGQVGRPRASPVELGFALVPRDQLFAKTDDTAGAVKAAARDLFTTRHWKTPPPSPSPEQPAPPPVAPPVPYTFLGKKLEGDAWDVFLAKGEQTFIVRTSQVMESDWRVDKIAPPTLTLTYLPLGLSQTLSIGETR